MTKSRKVAVLISSANFPKSNGTLQPLRCPPNDVDGLAAVLREPLVGGFADVKLVKDQDHQVAERCINEVLRDAGREDLVLIYYSGHGKSDLQNNLYLTTPNTEPNLVASTSIRVGMIRDFINGSSCQRVVLILDCCYSGFAKKVFTKGADLAEVMKQFAREMPNGRGTFIMTAARGPELATEKEGDRFSTFTKHLIQGLDTGAADLNKDGVVTVDELFQYVSTSMRKEGATHEPTSTEIEATGALVVAGVKVRARRVDTELTQKVRHMLGGLDSIKVMPATLRHMCDDALEAVEHGNVLNSSQEAVWGLLSNAVTKELPPADLFEQMLPLRTGIAGESEKSEIGREDRYDVVRSARGRVFDLVVPTYLLDSKYHWIDWNPLFDEIVAQPLGLVRGRHAADFVLALENRVEVTEHSIKTFPEGRPPPLVDTEFLFFRSPRYGMIRFLKIAAQVPGVKGGQLVWSICLDILSADNEGLLREDIKKRLTAEVNWSKYAAGYDRMLLAFDEYVKVVDTVTAMAGDARLCADLAAGTGNAAVALLKARDDRKVWAFESNDLMLEKLWDKTKGQPFKDRLHVIKGRLQVSLQEFEESSFDAAVVSNPFYGIDDRPRCLVEVYRVLKPGGVLAMSTSHRDTNVKAILDKIKEALAAKGRLDDLRPDLDDAYERCEALEAAIPKDSKEAIDQYVTAAGFTIEEKIDSAWAGAAVIIKARKR